MTSRSKAKTPGPAIITQDDVDALWLASRITVDIGDNPHNLRTRATERLQELAAKGLITWECPWRDQPTLNFAITES